MVGIGSMELLTAVFFLITPAGPYGQPASGATVFKHVPEGVVLVVGVDVASLAQGLDQGFDKLMKAPFMKKSPVLKAGAMALQAAKETMLQQARQVGIDPLKDVRYLMACMQPGPQGDSRALVVAGGKFPPGILDTLAELSGNPRQGEMLLLEDDPGGQVVLARDKSGALVFGNKPWVEDALAGKHANKSLKPLLKDYDRSTYFMVAFRPDEAIRGEWAQEDPMARPLLDHLEAVSMRMTYKSEIIKVIATDKKFVDVYKGLLDGFGQMTVAGHQFATGILTAGEAYLGSLEPVSRVVDNLPQEEQAIFQVLVENRREIRKFIQNTFLGKTSRAVARGLKAQRAATLTITGRGPSAFLFLGGVVGWLTLRGAAEEPVLMEAPAEKAEPPPAPMPAR